MDDRDTTGFGGFLERIKRNPVMVAASLLITVVAVVVSFAGDLRELAGFFAKPQAVALDGRWVSDELANPFDPAHRYRVILNLQRHGDAVAGQLAERRADGHEYGARGILDGMLDGNRISFHTQEQSLYGSETVSYRNVYLGTVGDDGIRFTLQSDRPWGFPTQTFVARRE